ncbi:MAG: UDP-N-acetylmuramoyl-L-alanyl-D-glutamate--2,6-diaminopimelate ligase [Candidatus Improbicoccus pseudotrichonymphae]|uniref:UDP-N-acetylmuramoyl-L-alanyl-D-glutamate--2,6-diaminopimelate ligase n=1 Tax=Candidatus Improbicoccus pseudotrichonymphae TaxID=3033792 RepID=A0AA48IGW8_9FIRM|nr:MAG: UDP-N-acetylmuramoyl-L-alanyl-D-glutamate--2,6-diaminopimelate ligase [Candidatus Improbicoccus pseudotrichonymphae]
MYIKKILRNLDIISSNLDLNLDIKNIVRDTRDKNLNGCLFVCIKGVNFDGHDFVDKALEKGALVIIGEKPFDCRNYILVTNSKKALAVVSANFFGNPAERLKIIAITGTKGKTTTAAMINSCLNYNKSGCSAVIGTLGITLIDSIIKTENTTPDSYELHRTFRLLVDKNYKFAVIEASSIGLKQYRLFGISFFISVFTNFSKDHIGNGEHENIEDYFNSKLILFENTENSIINEDEKCFNEIKKKTRSKNTISFGIEKGEIRAKNIKFILNESEICTEFNINKNIYKIGILGKFNVYNFLAAYCVCQKIGLDHEILKKALRGFRVLGRAEVVISENYKIIIDYAHNYDSMKNILSSLLEYKPKRLVTLFGAGGNRSRERRFGMGEISGKLSDLTIITSDNPRTESIENIIEDIEVGIKKTKGKYKIIKDRAKAIEYCMKNARSGDVIVLCGKGHENYQEIENKRYYFNEKEIILSYRARSEQQNQLN